MLTTFLLTPDEQYIITADRDEHVRVSWYPQGYNIERYRLGHEKSVVSLPSSVIVSDALIGSYRHFTYRSSSRPP